MSERILLDFNGSCGDCFHEVIGDTDGNLYPVIVADDVDGDDTQMLLDGDTIRLFGKSYVANIVGMSPELVLLGDTSKEAEEWEESHPMAAWTEDDTDMSDIHTLETVDHESGLFRVRIVNDPEPYDLGDLFTRAGTSGMPEFDAMTDDELAAKEREYLDALAENGGPWAFIVERKCPACGSWKQVDSCWGFDGHDHSFAREEGVNAMNSAAKAMAVK